MFWGEVSYYPDFVRINLGFHVLVMRWTYWRVFDWKIVDSIKITDSFRYQTCWGIVFVSNFFHCQDIWMIPGGDFFVGFKVTHLAMFGKVMIVPFLGMLWSLENEIIQILQKWPQGKPLKNLASKVINLRSSTVMGWWLKGLAVSTFFWG